MDKEEILKELNTHFAEINKFGISTEQIVHQLEIFERGALFADIIKPCKKGDGIFVIDESKHQELLEIHRLAAISGRLIKFVPASGAASRMFSKIQSYLNESEFIPYSKLKEDSAKNSDARSVYEFITNLKYFAFYDQLKAILKNENIDLETISDEDDVSIILKRVLDSKGLNYSFYPKGAILFHKHKEKSRTAFEEHLFEAINLAADQSNSVKIHFTIAEEHSDLVSQIINNSTNELKKGGIKLNVTYSYQKKSTNTISVTLDNKPFKESNGKFVFRPAGHGALIENLNELDCDIVLIKNIDNILPSTKNDESIKYKKLMTGFLVSIQEQIFNYLQMIESKKANGKVISEITKFVSEFLSISLPGEFDKQTTDEKAAYLFSKLNRPLRVCGMVKNEGHPGGGPFFVRDLNGAISIQIVEESQINKENSEHLEIFNASTYFNPVDMVCALRDFKGKKYNLKNYVDGSSGLITTKSYEGKSLKALELPGLWNGSMTYWNTVFVEMPADTFNPVKEINDLLKPAHQVKVD